MRQFPDIWSEIFPLGMTLVRIRKFDMWMMFPCARTMVAMCLIRQNFAHIGYTGKCRTTCVTTQERHPQLPCHVHVHNLVAFSQLVLIIVRSTVVQRRKERLTN